MQETRTCTTCKRELPVTEFHKSAKGKCGVASKCKQCTRDYSHNHYLENKDEINAKNKAYVQANRKKTTDRQRQWVANNKELFAAYKRKYNQAHPEKNREQSRRWAAANPEKVKAMRKKDDEWKSYMVRRARVAAVYHESVDPYEILQRDKWRCKICGCETPKELRGTREPNAPEIDHIIPIALGGPHVRANLQCLCYKCNRRKRNNYEGQLAFA